MTELSGYRYIDSVKAVSSNLVSKDPLSSFEPIGIRKGCFKYGHHVIYNSGEF